MSLSAASVWYVVPYSAAMPDSVFPDCTVMAIMCDCSSGLRRVMVTNRLGFRGTSSYSKRAAPDYSGATLGNVAHWPAGQLHGLIIPASPLAGGTRLRLHHSPLC